MTALPSLERVRALLRYNPDTGQFTRLAASGGRRAGSPAGTSRTVNGYVYISVDAQRLLAHRVAWLLMTGAWPPEQIDHINCDRADNRWENLRPASVTENAWNSQAHRDNRSGRKGVYLHKESGLYHALLTVKGRKISLGYFKDLGAAGAAYERAAAEHFGTFARAS